MAISFYKWLMVPVMSFLLGNNKTEIPVSKNVFHPFHVSVTEVNHNAAEKTLETSCKIFTDDFEAALSKQYKVKVDLLHVSDKTATDKMISDYIVKHLQVKADNKIAVLNYLGFEVEGEAVFVYLQGNGISSVKNIDITNTILHDLYTDQTEIMHVTVGGNRKSLKIDYPTSQGSFQF